ncbi:MAG: AAA family ATPase [Actinomycetaceae bacterium]|nr:AAA family ATPase [Actinomycetaceae bacterium]
MSRPELPILYQRDDELFELSDAQRCSMRGELQIVLAKGDAGSGKTSLLNHFVSSLADKGKEAPTVAMGRSGNNYDDTDPYRLINRILHDLVSEGNMRDDGFFKRLGRAFKENAPTWLEVIPVGGQIASAFVQTVGSYMQNQDSSTRVPIDTQFQALLKDLSKDNGFVLIADDVQWADKSSITLLTNLPDDLIGEKILLVLSYRDDEAGSQRRQDNANSLKKSLTVLERYTDIKHLAIDGLNKRSVKRILSSKGLNYVPDLLAEDVVELSEGNALFIHEIGDYLVEQMKTTPDIVEVFEEFRKQGSFTERMRKVFEARLDTLTEEKHTLLKKCAILGYEFDPELLEALWDDSQDRIWELLDQLMEIDRILAMGKMANGDECYRFANKRLADYLNHTTKSNGFLWKRHHSRIAKHLERVLAESSGDHLRLFVQIAHHYTEADDLTRALPYIVKAAKAAYDSGGYYEVCELGSRLRDSDFAEQSELWEPFFESAQWISAFSLIAKKWELIKRSKNLSGDLAVTIARGHRMLNRWDECIEILDLVELDETDSKVLARKEMLLGEVKLCGISQNVDEAVAHFKVAEELADNDELSYRAIGHQGLTLLCDENKITQAFVALERAITIAQRSDDSFKVYEAIHWLSKGQMAVLDLEGARDSVNKTISVAEKADVHKNNPYHYRDMFRIEALALNLEVAVSHMVTYTKGIRQSREWSEDDYTFEIWLSMLALQVIELKIMRRVEEANRLACLLRTNLPEQFDFRKEQLDDIHRALDMSQMSSSIEELKQELRDIIQPSSLYDAEQVFVFNIPDFWERRANAAR